MPSIEYPTVPPTPRHRLFVLFWAGIFFVLLNIGVAAMYGSAAQEEHRFRYHVSYEEVRGMLDRIHADPRKKVVFIGGSIMWGKSVPDPDQAIPGAFAQLLPKNVSVYNLGMIGARPLDQALLALLVRDSADLIVMDYNYQFGFPVSRERHIREPDTYIRLQQLYNTHAEELHESIPEIPACFRAASLTPPAKRSRFELLLQSFLERNIPLLRYKDRINDTLFGQHPLLLIEQLGLHAGDMLHGASITEFLKPPEAVIDPRPWLPTHSEEEEKAREWYESRKVTAKGLLPCITRAFAAYAERSKLPVVVYLSPNDPLMFPNLHHSPLHAQNVRTITSFFKATTFFNFDDGAFAGSLFTNSTHLTPAGNRAVAERLFKAILPQLRVAHLVP